LSLVQGTRVGVSNSSLVTKVTRRVKAGEGYSIGTNVKRWRKIREQRNELFSFSLVRKKKLTGVKGTELVTHLSYSLTVVKMRFPFNRLNATEKLYFWRHWQFAGDVVMTLTLRSKGVGVGIGKMRAGCSKGR